MLLDKERQKPLHLRGVRLTTGLAHVDHGQVHVGKISIGTTTAASRLVSAASKFSAAIVRTMVGLDSLPKSACRIL
jgi:hypothetical protein